MVCKAAVDSFQAECDRASVERHYSGLFGDHSLVDSLDDSLDSNSFASKWLNLTAQEQENKSSSDVGDDGSDGSCPTEFADSSSDDEVMAPMMRALRIKTFKKKPHNKGVQMLPGILRSDPRIIPADRSSNCGSLLPSC